MTHNNAHEFREDSVHPDDFPSATPASDTITTVASADDDDVSADKAIAHHFSGAKRVVDAKQCNPAALFRIRSCDEKALEALHHFRLRHAKSSWMQQQRLYMQFAALAAAHESMHPVIDDVDDDGQATRMRLVDADGFDAFGFLKCGIRVKPRKGFPPFWVCGQPEHCPRCNLHQRVKPAKAEFLPVFDEVKTWYSLTVIGRSNPDRAGVKIQLGKEPAKYLFRPADHFTFPRQRKFGLDDPELRPRIVGEALHGFMNWLTDGKYFDGLHAFRDMDLTFFPDRRSATGIGHTANCHVHAYGNSSRIFTDKLYQRMWFGCAKQLQKQGDGVLYAYPDILIRVLPTPEALKKAINYSIKPFKLAGWYLEALMHGCPVTSLNQEFYQTAFNVECALPGTSQGSVFGNMSQKSGRYYIGKPPPVKLSKLQVKRYLERSNAEEAYAWESERYQNHLKIVSKQCQSDDSRHETDP